MKTVQKNYCSFSTRKFPIEFREALNELASQRGESTQTTLAAVVEVGLEGLKYRGKRIFPEGVPEFKPEEAESVLELLEEF